MLLNRLFLRCNGQPKQKMPALFCLYLQAKFKAVAAALLRGTATNFALSPSSILPISSPVSSSTTTARCRTIRAVQLAEEKIIISFQPSGWEEKEIREVYKAKLDFPLLRFTTEFLSTYTRLSSASPRGTQAGAAIAGRVTRTVAIAGIKNFFMKSNLVEWLVYF